VIKNKMNISTNKSLDSRNNTKTLKYEEQEENEALMVNALSSHLALLGGEEEKALSEHNSEPQQTSQNLQAKLKKNISQEQVTGGGF